LEAVLLKASGLKSNIEKIIQIYKDSIGDDFARHVHSSEAKKSDKYENRNSIVVPKSTDPWILMVTGYMRQEFENIKGLISAPVLERGALISKITKSLSNWRRLLKDHTIPKEVSELMDELEDLGKNLAVDTEHISPIGVSNLRSDEEHIEGHVNIGNNSHRSVMLGLSSLKDCGSVWEKLIQDVKEKKKQHLSRIKELERALRLARSELSREQERMTRWLPRLQRQFLALKNC
jgi:hypothetical protein